MNLKPFTRCDWYGYCDAARFADGSEPLVGTMTVDGVEATVVVDANGVQIDTDDGAIYALVCGGGEAVVFAQALPAAATSELLAAAGMVACH